MARWQGRRGANGRARHQLRQAERPVRRERCRPRHRNRRRCPRERATVDGPRAWQRLAPRTAGALDRARRQESAGQAGAAVDRAAHGALHERMRHRASGVVADDPAELPFPGAHGGGSLSRGCVPGSPRAGRPPVSPSGDRPLTVSLLAARPPPHGRSDHWTGRWSHPIATDGPSAGAGPVRRSSGAGAGRPARARTSDPCPGRRAGRSRRCA